MNPAMLCLGLLLAQPPVPAEPLPVPVPLVTLAPACPTPVSVCDFAKAFQAVPGKYEVLFIHPVKGCPVQVCFELPPGKPCVKVQRRSLVFDYGCKCVTVQFKLLCGKWAVYYE